MNTTKFENGRRQALALASMNLRAVIGLYAVVYVAPPRSRSVIDPFRVGARFQPRDCSGRFVSYGELEESVNREYAMSAFEFDVLEDGFETFDEEFLDPAWVPCDDCECPDCQI